MPVIRATHFNRFVETLARRLMTPGSFAKPSCNDFSRKSVIPNIYARNRNVCPHVLCNLDQFAWFLRRAINRKSFFCDDIYISMIVNCRSRSWDQVLGYFARFKQKVFEYISLDFDSINKRLQLIDKFNRTLSLI